MAQISARTATLAKWAVIPVALLISGIAVSQASYSAFSARVDSPAATWEAGSIDLTNDSPTTTLFTAAGNLRPTDTETKCIDVSFAGTLDSTVKFYATDYAAGTTPLGTFIDLVITEGAPGATCAGFIPAIGSEPLYEGTLDALGTGVANDFLHGIPTNWAPKAATDQKRAFQITYTLQEGTEDSAQGGTASILFAWEAQNI